MPQCGSKKMERYRVNFSNHINNGWGILLVIGIGVFFPYFMSWIKHEDIESFNWTGILIFFVGALPALIIHINYYIVNFGDVFEYFDQKKQITIYHNSKSTTFSFDDIDYVQRSMSWNKAARRSFIFTWEGYNHSYIHLKDGRRFTVTSLLVPDLELPIEKEKIIVKENFYRLAKSY